ncbi:radical SAM protein [Streptomyces griseocarneus]|nr:radical SAM protein [Streptomyces griseocarneus]
MSEPSLVVAEVFGPTVQGEGPSLGQRAGFIRTAGCNLTCSWCDTPYTWDGTRHDLRAELRRVPALDIARRALSGAPNLVVITGGEPLLHQRQPGWDALLEHLARAGVDIEIETNGTVPPSPRTAQTVTRFNVSPKLQHAGDPERRRIRPAALSALHATGKAAFKFVCRTPGDVTAVARYTAAWGVPPSAVWVMPEGTNSARITAHLTAIADAAIDAQFNLTTRLHVHVWGEERER